MSSAPHIAIAAPSAYPVGGVQTWLDSIVPGLESAGWRVTVYLPDGAHSDAAAYLEHHPFPCVRRIRNSTGTREGRVRALHAALEGDAPDMVLGVNIADLYEAAHRARGQGHEQLKIVMAMHGNSSCTFGDLERLRRVVDAVVCTNRLGVRAAVAISRMDRPRVFHAPCGVPVPELPAWPVARRPLELLYAGRFDDIEKRVLDLPEILAHLAHANFPFQLKLAGAGPDAQKLADALQPFAANVQFSGMLDQRQLSRSFYTPGAVLLILSRSETGPLAAWEAMANGVAVCTSRFVGLQSEGALHPEENCLAFATGDTAQAAETIIRLADGNLRKRLAEAGWQTVKQRYSLQASIEKWDFALRTALSLPRLATTPFPIAQFPSGRLDHLLGDSLAETARHWLGRSFSHAEAGAEWPHTYTADNPAHASRLTELDNGGID